MIRYANNESYMRAIEDFEKALQINRNHVNARKYMCETLIVYSRRSVFKYIYRCYMVVMIRVWMGDSFRESNFESSVNISLKLNCLKWSINYITWHLVKALLYWNTQILVLVLTYGCSDIILMVCVFYVNVHATRHANPCMFDRYYIGTHLQF